MKMSPFTPSAALQLLPQSKTGEAIKPEWFEHYAQARQDGVELFRPVAASHHSMLTALPNRRHLSVAPVEAIRC